MDTSESLGMKFLEEIHARLHPRENCNTPNREYIRAKARIIIRPPRSRGRSCKNFRRNPEDSIIGTIIFVFRPRFRIFSAAGSLLIGK